MNCRVWKSDIRYWAYVRVILLAVMMLGISGTYVVADEAGDTSEIPTLMTALRIDSPLKFCGEEVPIDDQATRERFEKELLLSLWDRPQVILWLKRAPRYLPYIEKMLKDSELPDDLKYMAVAESALRPHAGSRKGAIGFWQFTPATGRKYGLIIDEYRDERRNIFTSTVAAIRYLKQLYEDFESWTLAAAAYNMGEEGLMAEILEQGIHDYYRLYLPLETQRYLFRILSVKLILSDPLTYGFMLTEKETYPQLSFDQVEVDCLEEIPIRIAAEAGSTHFKVVKDLNPELRGHYLARGKHTIRIPKGGAKDFQERFHVLQAAYSETRKEKIYIVKPGDNLSVIADKFGVPLAALIIWNRIDLKHPIHPGDRLIVYGEEELTDEDSE